MSILDHLYVVFNVSPYLFSLYTRFEPVFATQFLIDYDYVISYPLIYKNP